MRLSRRIEALEKRRNAQLEAAIEGYLALLTPAEQDAFMRRFWAEFESERGDPCD